jgi:hypothetical protein
MNFSPAQLKKLELLIKESGYTLRYEKGTFNSGYCVLLDKNVVIINKYFTDDVKFQKLLDIIQTLNFEDKTKMTEPSLKILEKLRPDTFELNQIPFEDVPK